MIAKKINAFNLDEAINILARTPQVLEQLLAGLPDHWLTQKEGPETWSPFDIVGHLIYGEQIDWIPRAQLILEDKRSTFDPFDRFAQFEASKGKTMDDLLAEFKTLRGENIQLLSEMQLGESELQMVGNHPDFGEVTLAQLLASWVVHDLGHIRQIVRVMAKQYKAEVGPWEKYLSVVNA